MRETSSSSRVVRFGVFEVDLRLGELRRNGLRVKLQCQPFEILVTLLQRPGELVTREELRRQLWPEDTFVDYEQGLNIAIKKLRDALGDSPHKPRFVETLARRGYRFIAQVNDQAEEPTDGRSPEEGVSRQTIDSARPNGDIEGTAADNRRQKPRLQRRVLWVSAIATLVAIIGFNSRRDTTGDSAIESLAILPFANDSGDPATEYLSDGIAESLINRFSRLPHLRIIARSSAFRYRGPNVDPKRVGRELDVRAVVMGRVLQRGDSLNIQVDLVDAADGRQLWGEQYRRKLTDVLAVQEEIATEISTNLRLRLTQEEQIRLRHGYTEDSNAYQAYLRGRYFWNKRTQAGMTKGIEYFQQAVEIDPGYALAYVGLADCYSMLGSYNYLSPDQTFPKATAYLAQAIRLDESLAEAHASQGYIMFGYTWDLMGAERELRRALELNSNYANAHRWYSHVLATRGRMSEATTEMRRAVDLDPLSLVAITSLGYHFFFAREYDQVIEQCRKALEMDPDFAWAHLRLGLAYEQKGMYDEAIAEFRKASSEDSSEIMAALGHVLGICGKKGEAEKVINHLKKLSREKYVSPYDVAMVYAGLGSHNDVFTWLEKAYEKRSWAISRLNGDPRFDEFRLDPRFQDLVHRISGLPRQQPSRATRFSAG